MSLYIFNMSSQSAVVTADSRLSITINDHIYKINDETQKIFHVDNMIITIGGHHQLAKLIMAQFQLFPKGERTPKLLNRLSKAVISDIDSLVDMRVLSPDTAAAAKENPETLLEICILEYNKEIQKNCFYQFASYTDYNITEQVITGQSFAYGGIKVDEAKTLLHDKCPELYFKTTNDYIDTIKSVYNETSYEGVGGTLCIVAQDGTNYYYGNSPIADSRKIKTVNEIQPSLERAQRIIGKNLFLENLSPDGKLMQFKVDASGASLYNSQFLLASDTGGAMLIDPEFGFAIGANKTGYPLWNNNEDGTHSLNKENATLFTDLDGTLNLKNINATGKIYGSILQGNEMYVGGDNTAANCKFGVDAEGNLLGMETQNGQMRFDANGNATFDADVNIGGNLNMTGNVKWSSNAFPVQSQYSVNGVTDWHKNMATADMYKRDMIFDGAWGMAYKFRGKDGNPGSDGDPRAYLNSIGITEISSGSVKSPRIEGGKIFGADIYGGAFWDLNGMSKLVLNPQNDSSGNANFAIYSGDNIAFGLSDEIIGAIRLLSFGIEFLTTGQWGTSAKGKWDFSSANVTGLSVPGHFM